MARPVTPESLLRKSLRLMSKHLSIMNRNLTAGNTLTGPEASALASYVSTLRATVKMNNAQRKERSAATTNLSNEELAKRAAEVLKRQNPTTTTAPAVEGAGHGEEPVRDA